MKLKILSVVIILTIITLYISIVDLSPEDQQKTVIINKFKNATTPHKAPKNENASTVNKHDKPLAPLSKTNAIPSSVQQNNNLLWVVTDGKNAKPFPFPNPRKINHRYLKLNNAAISSLKPGENFNIYIPQSARHYNGVIAMVNLNANGVNSYFGSFLDHGRQFTFTITQGKNTTYAKFNTPDGQFSLESQASDAWISNTQDERKTLDFSKTDVMTRPPQP